VIAATNRDIESEVAADRFRQDLMYRLNAVTIHLPPLRERVEDIMMLAAHFALKVRPEPVQFSDTVTEMLENYHWEGNVRELENAVLHAVSLADNTIFPEHLPARIRDFRKASAYYSVEPKTIGDPESSDSQWKSLAEMETEYANQVLKSTGGNKQAAARLLNIDRKTLARIISRKAAED
jgi:DNA-binding NtrC family response regulator